MQIERASNNIAELLRERALANANKFALRTADTELTFAETYQRVCALALALKEYGVSKGDVVALSLPDPLEHFVAFMSVVHQGAVVFSLSQSMPTLLKQTLLEQTGAKFLLYSQEDEAAEFTTQFLSSIDVSKVDTKARTDCPAPVVVCDDDPWHVAHGSGSTGAPKLLTKTHKQQRARFEKAKDWIPITAEDTFLSLSSIHFSASKGMALQAWGVGACVYLSEPGKLDFAKEVESGAITAIYGTPYHVQMLLQRTSKSSTRLYEKLNALMLTSAPVPMSMRADIQTYLTDRLYVLWGTNEASICSVTSLDSVFVTNQTVGHMLPWVTIQIVDDNDNELEVGQAGHIRIKTDALIDGYQGDDASTRETFKDGWFYPKDIGHLTKDGQLIYHGRSDHMMMVGGVNVNPRQVENILLKDPDIYDAHVTSIEHPSAGESPVALLVPATSSALDLKKIVANVRSEIGAHSLHFAASLDELPRTDQGKLPQKDVDRLTHYLFAHALNPNRQAPSTVSLSFAAPSEPIRDDRLSSWIHLLAPQHDLTLLSPHVKGVTNTAENWLAHSVSVLHVLLHLLQVPLFDRILSKRCSPSSDERNKWLAELIAPPADLVPPVILRQLMPLAFKLAHIFNETDPYDMKLRNAVYLEVVERVIKRFPEGLSRGRSSFQIMMKARELGVRTRVLPQGIIHLGWGKNSRLFDRSGTIDDSNIGSQYCSNKLSSAQLLALAGLPAPTHIPVRTVEEAKKASRKIKYPLVVKPADRERGEGVTTDVKPDTLATAFETAQKASKTGVVLVEQQVPGVCHRLFIAYGKLLYAVKRLPMGVYADGERTIGEIVSDARYQDQSRAPWNRDKMPTLDPLAIKTMGRLGFKKTSIPEREAFIPLRPIESTKWGGVDEDVTQVIHPDNIQIAVQACQLLGLSVAGIDIISTDISASWVTSGAVINEVNQAPLLGGGEISKSYLSEYLHRCLPNLGQIPIHIFVGGSGALRMATAYFDSRSESATGIFLLEGSRVRSQAGHELNITTDSLLENLQAVALRPDLSELIICVQTPKCLREVQALNAITSCTFAEGEDLSSLYASTTIDDSETQTLLDALLDKKIAG